MPNLDQNLAERLARLTLSHLGREYPYHLTHVVTGSGGSSAPRDLYPIFHGSYDWHSCVHGWWQVLTLLRRFPETASATEIRTRADEMLTPERVAGEVAYFERPSAQSFERPYGWGWLLALHSEAAQHEAPWATALAPLAQLLADRFADHLRKLTYPVRSGVHSSTPFALIHALGWGRRFSPVFAQEIETWSREKFFADQACQAWEPSGEDFLSPALTEALLMARVLSTAEFASWFRAFLPDLAAGSPGALLRPAFVSDRSDGKIGHLDGLNLSRAWCWKGIAAALPPDDPVRNIALRAAEEHLNAGLPHVAGDYLSEHWLATFALLAMID